MIVFCMVSCYRDDLVLRNDNRSNEDPLSKANGYLARNNNGKMIIDPERPHRINSERAMLIAKRVPALFDENSARARSIPKQTANVVPLGSNVSSKGRSATNEDDILVYIVNYANEQGYAVISFDDRDGDVLAYFEEGNFNLQDTVEDAALKLHIDMMLAYQQYTRNQIKTAEEQGMEYVGSMESIDFDNEGQPSITRGIGGAGLPGLPGNTPNPNYQDRRWEGKDNAITAAEKRYPNVVFGTQNNPPNIPFSTGQPGALGPDTPCPTPPYCNPPVQNYDQYYYYYGATYIASRTVYEKAEYIEPLIKTYWSQREPLNYNVPMCQIPFHFNCKDIRHAGCAPIALGQMMTYHRWPLEYTCGSHTHPLNFELWEKKKSNDDLSASDFGDDVGKFIREIGQRLGVTYTCNGSGPMSLGSGTGGVQNVFISFKYSIGYNGAWNYKDADNFWRVRQSIVDKQPIFIYGFPRGWTGFLNYFNGHTWILDGYVNIAKSTLYYEKFYFDEYGKFCKVERGKSVTYPGEFIHANMGRKASAYEKAWIRRGVYDRWGEIIGQTEPEDYSGKLYYIAGIKPKR